MDEEKNLNEAAEEVTEAAETVAEEAVADAAEETANVVEEVAEEATEAEEAVENVAEEAEEAEEATEAEEEVADEAEIADEAMDAVEDSVEDISEAAEEAAELMGETVADKTEAEILGEEIDEVFAENTVTPEDKTTKTVTIAVCAAIAVAIIVLAIIFLPKLFGRNPYNKYIDTTGRTIGEIAELSGLEYEEFLEVYSLPADMPKDTNESSAFNTIPISKVLEMYQYENMKTVDEAKEVLGLPDWINDNTPWGEAVGEAPLIKYVGEENLDSFLERYGLTGTANGDTLYKEVRQTVDEADKKEREEYEKQMEELQAQMQQAANEQPSSDEQPADDAVEVEQSADAAPAQE